MTLSEPHESPIPAAGVRLSIDIGRDAENLLTGASRSGMDGALAALTTFYCGFNGADADLLREVWAEADKVRLMNPVGGVLDGADEVAALYARIFTGGVRVWVAYSDVTAYMAGDMVVFAGRERGEFQPRTDDGGGSPLPLSIRTSRIFAYIDGRWRQVHHHGSIDDAELLAKYQAAVRGT
ncbi:MAG: YybH family protein [Leptospirillia bacterium]